MSTSSIIATRVGTTIAVTWLIIMLLITGHIAFVNLMPTSHWLDFTGVEVKQEENRWWVTLNRAVSENREVRQQVELHEDSKGDDRQYCSASNFTTAEPTKLTRIPLSSLLPDCNFRDPLMQGKPLRLQVTYVIGVGYGFTRSTTHISNPFTLNIAPEQQIAPQFLVNPSIPGVQQTPR